MGASHFGPTCHSRSCMVLLTDETYPPKTAANIWGIDCMYLELGMANGDAFISNGTTIDVDPCDGVERSPFENFDEELSAATSAAIAACQ